MVYLCQIVAEYLLYLKQYYINDVFYILFNHRRLQKACAERTSKELSSHQAQSSVQNKQLKYILKNLFKEMVEALSTLL